ncbi:MAG: hypothetical protein Hens3KO_00580 [Henriciella sp.]
MISKVSFVGALALSVAACSGGGGSSSSAPTSALGSGGTSNGGGSTVSQSLTDTEATEIAMKLWRNNDASKHPKGSCAGCHGADFFDLARIGTTSEDVIRRAKIDGATEAEADALAQAVEFLRADMNMPQTNARTFRPFQPGGERILGELPDHRRIASIKRDIAFGEQLESLLPTLFGPPINTLELAKKARDEYLDIINGTNLAGANPQEMSLRKLPTGISYPQWSADLHHGVEEGTLNDWIADVAHEPTAENREEWLNVQQAYLDNPSSYNFWKMWLASSSLTTQNPIETCKLTDANSERRCASSKDFSRHKFRAALIGQHLMRTELLSYDSGFVRDAVGFAYVGSDPEFKFMLDRNDGAFVPADMWLIADVGKVMLGGSLETGTLLENLDNSGFPEFVENSIDPQRASGLEEHDLRLSWFWVGFTFDPTFQRTHKSNSTKTAEYMTETLLKENLHMHNTFMNHARLVAKGHLQDGNVRQPNRQLELEALPPVFDMNYSYFIAYNRHLVRWNEDLRTGPEIPQDLKDQQQTMWTKFTGNGYRMSLHLYLEEMKAGNITRLRNTYPITAHFETYSAENETADKALTKAVIDEAANAGIE